MNFMGPLPFAVWAWIAGGAALLTVSAYIIKMRRRRFEVPFSHLWKRVLEQNVCESVLEREIKSVIVITEEQAKEALEEEKGEARAEVLTILGDLPDKDAAPERNVLFVCKLNPITTSEDLEVCLISATLSLVTLSLVISLYLSTHLSLSFLSFLIPCTLLWFLFSLFPRFCSLLFFI